MPQTYCTRVEIESILSAPGLLALIDDDADGVESPQESAYIGHAIERAAVEINHAADKQYVLTDLAGNAWMKWANATLAVMFLAKRRNNPLPESIAQDVQQIREQLTEIRWGRDGVPDAAPSFDHSAAVSNLTPQLGHGYAPVRVNVQESTGEQPVGDRKRNITQPIYPYV
jgi:hypothetical protein